MVCKNCGASFLNKRTNHAYTFCSRKCYLKQLKKMGPNKGRIFSKRWKENISKARKRNAALQNLKYLFLLKKPPYRIAKGKRMSPQTEFKKGQIPWNKGLTINDSRVESYTNKNRCQVRPNMQFEKHPNWLGGKAFEEYGIEFNNRLKRQIKMRDNCICQNCKRKFKFEKLAVHHIDSCKRNNNPINLITLCNSCHTSLHWDNGERSGWRFIK